MRPKFGAAWPAFHSSFALFAAFIAACTPSRFKTNAGHLTLFRAPAIDQLPFEKMFVADVKG
jgi:hypothetical protein